MRSHYHKLLGVVLISLLTLTTGLGQAQGDDPSCFVEYTGDNVTDFATVDASAIQQAIDASSDGATIKIAGTCGGVILRDGQVIAETVFIDKAITLVGGYGVVDDTLDWLASPDPAQFPTLLEAQEQGRVITHDGGNLELRNLAIIGGNVTANGGGVSSRDTLRVINSLILNNSANKGGGIHISEFSQLAVVNSYIGYNVAEQGSGIFVQGTSPTDAFVELVNVTLSYNETTTGSVLETSNTSVKIFSSTFVFNRGDAMLSSTLGGDIRLTNSIIGGNIVTTGECGNGVLSGGGNSFGVNGNAGNCPGQLTDIVPVVDAESIIAPIVSFDGGSNAVHLPAPGSPVVDSGIVAQLPPDAYDLDDDGNTTEPLPVDGRGPGFARIVYANVDIGAVEYRDDPAPSIILTSPEAWEDIEPHDGTLTIEFDERVNVSGDGVQLVCGATLISLAGLPANDVDTLELTTEGLLPFGESCTLTIDSDAVADTDGFDPPDTLADDFTLAFNVVIPRCFAEYTGDNVTDFASSDNTAAQKAVDAAPDGGTVKIAGTCGEPSWWTTNNYLYSLVDIPKSLTLIGGYGPPGPSVDWLTLPDPRQYPTILNADGKGGGIRVSGGEQVTVRNVIVQNAATRFLEAFEVYGDVDMRIINTVIRDNGGIGILQEDDTAATLTVVNSAIYNNTGVGIMADSHVIVRNSTISGNYRGIEQNSRESASLEMYSTTMVNNESMGLRFEPIYADESVTIYNSIISNNGELFRNGSIITSSDCRFLEGWKRPVMRNNIVGSNGEDGGCPLGPPAQFNRPIDNFVNLLEPTIADNGGIVPTYALVEHSIAIDSGWLFAPGMQDTFDLDNDGDTDEAISVDGRGPGYPRVLGEGLDIGAFEGTVTLVEADATPDNPTLGQIEVTFMLINHGVRPLTDTIEVYYSINQTCDPTYDSLLISEPITDLAVGATMTRRVSVYIDRNTLHQNYVLRTSVKGYVCVIFKGKAVSDDFTYFPYDIAADDGGDRAVTPTDVTFVLNRLGEPLDTSDTHPYADINADGVIDENDVEAVAAMLGTEPNPAVFEE